MAIKEGDKLPSMKVKVVENGEMKEASTDDLFGQGRHVIFALPGAFTPTCSAKHLPGFNEKKAELKGRGVGTIACLSVNDAFVMKAWEQQQGTSDIVMIADGNADLTKALGLELDATANAMGVRSKRYAMVIQDGKVERLFVEEPGNFSVSSADHVLANL